MDMPPWRGRRHDRSQLKKSVEKKSVRILTKANLLYLICRGDAPFWCGGVHHTGELRRKDPSAGIIHYCPDVIAPDMRKPHLKKRCMMVTRLWAPPGHGGAGRLWIFYI
jgi:hypothetical protein